MKKLLITLILFLTASMNALGNEQISLDTSAINEKLQQILQERLEMELVEISNDYETLRIAPTNTNEQLVNDLKGNVLITE